MEKRCGRGGGRILVIVLYTHSIVVLFYGTILYHDCFINKVILNQALLLIFPRRRYARIVFPSQEQKMQLIQI